LKEINRGEERKDVINNIHQIGGPSRGRTEDLLIKSRTILNTTETGRNVISSYTS